MIESFIILSDIHGNLSALDSVLKDIEYRKYHPTAIAILGDIVNYGMRPNEVIERLQRLSDKYRIIINLSGNHEKAIADGDTTHFSTERGRKVVDFTQTILSEESKEYLINLNKEGYSDFEIDGLRLLFVHGSIEDPYWGVINRETMEDLRYSKYDFVISGHSHVPHLIEKFYPSEIPEYRHKKRTVFLNPGSVGQPRNHNPQAQYLYCELKSEIFHFNSVKYDIEKERSLFNDKVDKFYSDRLIKGI